MVSTQRHRHASRRRLGCKGRPYYEGQSSTAALLHSVQSSSHSPQRYYMNPNHTRLAISMPGQTLPHTTQARHVHDTQNTARCTRSCTSTRNNGLLRNGRNSTHAWYSFNPDKNIHLSHGDNVYPTERVSHLCDTQCGYAKRTTIQHGHQSYVHVEPNNAVEVTGVNSPAKTRIYISRSRLQRRPVSTMS